MQHNLDTKELFNLMESGMTKKEFLEAFKQIVELIKKLQTSNSKTMSVFGSDYIQTVNEIKANYDKDMSDVKEKAMRYCMEEMAKITRSHENRILGVESMVNGMEAEITPRIALKASEIARGEVLPLIPTIEAIEEDLPQLGLASRDGLELLPEEDKLKIEAIKGLREELDKLEKRIMLKTVSFGGGGGVGKHNVVYYDLSPSLDGVTRTFTLPSFYKIVDVKLNSVPVMRLDTDYTVDGSLSTITFTDEISLNDISSGMSCVILYSE